MGIGDRTVYEAKRGRSKEAEKKDSNKEVTETGTQR